MMQDIINDKIDLDEPSFNRKKDDYTVILLSTYQ